ncbi:hypothetical protein ABZO31_33950 [Streptomyces sp. HUAS MG47]|uniref:hypothetical protein n=1 Tax=Streptomyces solicamelliae TaxID=3231716 RepID=UPI003878201E
MENTPRQEVPVHAVAHLAHRWPTFMALACVAVVFWDGAVNWQPFAVLMITLPGVYLVVGALRGELRTRRAFGIQLCGLVLWSLPALLAFAVGGRAAVYIVAAAWFAHSAWDFAHHRARAVVPRAYAEWCMVVDALVAVGLLAWA